MYIWDRIKIVFSHAAGIYTAGTSLWVCMYMYVCVCMCVLMHFITIQPGFVSGYVCMYVCMNVCIHTYVVYIGQNQDRFLHAAGIHSSIIQLEFVSGYVCMYVWYV
jgi:hypothetical protein